MIEILENSDSIDPPDEYSLEVFIKERLKIKDETPSVAAIQKAKINLEEVFSRSKDDTNSILVGTVTKWDQLKDEV